MVLAAGLAPALATLSTSCLCVGLREHVNSALDTKEHPWPVSFTGSHPALSGRAGPLELLRVQEFEMVRASGNAPEPGTDLVRCGV